MNYLEAYKAIQGQEVTNQLLILAEQLKGKKVVHVNSTKVGGGVAEILDTMIPFLNSIGVKSSWKVISGNEQFFECTKFFHNAIQGKKDIIFEKELLKSYEDVGFANAIELKDELEEADFVFIHDPQPLPLIACMPKRKGKWIWRCHIDASDPHRFLWNYLLKYISQFDASIFSLAEFARPMPHPIYIIPPSIHAFNDKNRELTPLEIQEIVQAFQLDPLKSIILQVSRFDRFKDPWGVIEAFKIAKKYRRDMQLVLAGGGATDDPEGAAILTNIQKIALSDSDIHVIFLPPNSNKIINALQRASDVVLQKSIKEGFGLTIAEALWKEKPVIGGNTGGIKLQVFDYHTGFLVNTPEGAANRIRYFLEHTEEISRMGKIGRSFVRDHFLITRHIKDYLSLLIHQSQDGLQSRSELF